MVKFSIEDNWIKTTDENQKFWYKVTDFSSAQNFDLLESLKKFNIESLGKRQKIIDDLKRKILIKQAGLKDFNYFLKLKRDKRFLVDGFVYPATTVMWFSPPAQFKSLLALNLAMCISNGKPFLGMRTKKAPVLYCDRENNEQILKTRLMGIFKGANYRYKRFPLWVLVKEGSLDDSEFISRLKVTIKEFEIKLVVFDTLHRFADYEENRADDISRLYVNVLQPIVDECDCAVMFLHHTNKDGGYRGSADFLGMVDVAYSVTRKKSTDQFEIENIKSRSGEIEKIAGEIVFSNDSIKFIPLEQAQLEEQAINKKKEATTIIRNLYPIAGQSLTFSEIIDHFEIDHTKKFSPATIKRCLKYLVRENWLENKERGKYTRV